MRTSIKWYEGERCVGESAQTDNEPLQTNTGDLMTFETADRCEVVVNGMTVCIIFIER